MSLKRVPQTRYTLRRTYHNKGAFTKNVTKREAKVGNFGEWMFSSHAQNRPTIYHQLCLTKVWKPLAKIATGCNFLQVVNDVTFWLLSFPYKRTLTLMKYFYI